MYDEMLSNPLNRRSKKPASDTFLAPALLVRPHVSGVGIPNSARLILDPTHLEKLVSSVRVRHSAGRPVALSALRYGLLSILLLFLSRRRASSFAFPLVLQS